MWDINTICHVSVFWRLLPYQLFRWTWEGFSPRLWVALSTFTLFWAQPGHWHVNSRDSNTHLLSIYCVPGTGLNSKPALTYLPLTILSPSRWRNPMQRCQVIAHCHPADCGVYHTACTWQEQPAGFFSCWELLERSAFLSVSLKIAAILKPDTMVFFK